MCNYIDIQLIVCPHTKNCVLYNITYNRYINKNYNYIEIKKTEIIIIMYNNGDISNFFILQIYLYIS